MWNCHHFRQAEGRSQAMLCEATTKAEAHDCLAKTTKDGWSAHYSSFADNSGPGNTWAYVLSTRQVSFTLRTLRVNETCFWSDHHKSYNSQFLRTGLPFHQYTRNI